MLTVTSSLTQAFESKLSLRNIPDQQHHDFHKWLRFYLDFSISTLWTRSLTLVLPGLTTN
ncbi:hypothetical protein EDE11_13137 [Methylomonas methanica]|uniref:Uncharacterized protein n=1 Tax=Methylomonas methanica TaxID=421 RepID=A0ABY2CGN2_METMH|nr:hypothetical protein EDE11_13137 [Methylomonas methanica]